MSLSEYNHELITKCQSDVCRNCFKRLTELYTVERITLLQSLKQTSESNFMLRQRLGGLESDAIKQRNLLANYQDKINTYEITQKLLKERCQLLIEQNEGITETLLELQKEKEDEDANKIPLIVEDGETSSVLLKDDVTKVTVTKLKRHKKETTHNYKTVWVIGK